MPARDRHALGGRTVRRDRRLRAVRARRAVDELRRVGPPASQQPGSSGGSGRSRGPVQHARRLLVEAAWHYRPRPRIGKTLTERQDSQPAEAIAISSGQPNSACTAPGHASSNAPRRTIIAVAAARSSLDSAGRSPRSNDPTPKSHIRRLGRWRPIPGNARGNPRYRLSSSNPPPKRWLTSRSLDSSAPHDEPSVLRHPQTRVYQSDRASPHQPDRTATHHSRPQPPDPTRGSGNL